MKKIDLLGNVNMNRVGMLGSIMWFIIWFLFLDFCLESDLEDYLHYTNNTEKYNIEKVKVEETKSPQRTHSKWGYFYYYDNFGVRKQGVVPLNYDEHQGDYIEVAFDEYRMYIRPIVTVSIKGILDYIFWIVITICMIVALIKEYRENKKQDSLYDNQS